MDRRGLIREKGNDLLRPRFYQNLSLISQKYKECEEDILRRLISGMEELFQKAEKLQRQKERGKLACLGVTYCLSSVYTNDYGIRLELYDKDYYLDETECCLYWYPDFIFDFLAKDIEYFQKTIKREVPRIKTFEIRQFVMGYMKNYIFLLAQFVEKKMPELLQEFIKDNPRCESDFRIFYGEYMGRYIMLEV